MGAASKSTVTPSNAGDSPTAPLRRIVVGTDFSDAAGPAMQAAGDLALAHKAELIVVHGVDPMVAATEIDPQVIIQDVRAGLDEVADAFRKRHVNVSTQMRLGKGWWAIGETARETSADLVVVASHGRTGLARAALGSTADRTVRTCHTPVLIVPSQWKGSTTVWKSAVVGVDFSEEAAIATSMAARLLARSSAPRTTLTLFHTVALTIEFRQPEGPVALPEYWNQAEAEATHQIDGLAATLRGQNMDVRVSVHRGYPSDGLLSEARTSKADLIAVGTHGRNSINRALLGSVAERVLHHAERPVVTVRHPSARDAVGVEGGGTSGSKVLERRSAQG